jgi:hypothetical protein
VFQLVEKDIIYPLLADRAGTARVLAHLNPAGPALRATIIRL